MCKLSTPPDQRSTMMAPGILINIDVDHLERATAFYCTLLQLRVGRRFGDGGVELLGGAVPFYLLVKPAGSLASAGSGERRRYTRHWTPVHLDFVVPNLQEAVACAKAAGASVESDIETHAWGRIALLADPFGNGFCLLQFVGRGYDEIARQNI
jgi:predicted enzyme related to lactoylglutathione lyase